MVVAGDAHAQRTARARDPVIGILRPVNPPEATLQVIERDPTVAQGRAHPVTDLAVRLKPAPELPLGVALGLGNGDRRVGRRPIFHVELLLVARGRLLVEERAECGAWSSDVSICRAECDGGSFALVRQPGGRTSQFRLVIGHLPDTAADAIQEGVRLAACAEGEAPERIVVPRGGSAQHVELRSE